VDRQILIIFGKTIPDTTSHQMVIQVFTLPNIMLLHYLEKSKHVKLAF